jgi:uncharacterized protein YcfJ
MKRILVGVLCLGFVFLIVGCQNTQTRATEGAVIGGILGAATGGIIGHQTHHGGEGAAIGAAVGAVTGGLIGSQIEKPGQTPAANPKQMSIQEIIDLTQQGTPENIIADKIKATHSKFALTEADINYLKKQGVTQKVIDTMQGKL